jgi:hypothetical protein
MMLLGTPFVASRMSQSSEVCGIIKAVHLSYSAARRARLVSVRVVCEAAVAIN